MIQDPVRFLKTDTEKAGEKEKSRPRKAIARGGQGGRQIRAEAKMNFGKKRIR